MNNTPVKDHDEYITRFPVEIQVLLEQVRSTVKKAAPDALEVISYQMPAFRLNGILVYYAAHSKHIGFYPMASGIDNFRKELSSFHTSIGTVQFPFNKPLPLELIRRITAFRADENKSKTKRK